MSNREEEIARVHEIIKKNNVAMRRHYDSNKNFVNPVTQEVWNSPNLYDFLPNAPLIDTTGSLSSYPCCMIRAPYEYYVLHHLAKSVPENGKILEIGTAWGGTSALMSRANPTVTIETWDPFELNDTSWTKKWEAHYKRPWSHESTLDFLKEFPNINVNKGLSPQDLDVSTWKYDSLDMLFEDADHAYMPTLLNLFYLIPYVKKGGIVAGHDYSTGFPGVVDAVNKAHSLFAKGQLFLCNTLWFFYKK
jgi:hypothetical protein